MPHSSSSLASHCTDHMDIHTFQHRLHTAYSYPYSSYLLGSLPGQYTDSTSFPFGSSGSSDGHSCLDYTYLYILLLFVEWSIAYYLLPTYYTYSFFVCPLPSIYIPGIVYPLGYAYCYPTIFLDT